MAKITLSLSSKQDKITNKRQILFRFIGNSTIALRAKSGIFIDPKQWNEKRGELKSATFGRDEAKIKVKLSNLCNTIIDSFTQTNITQVDKEWLNTVIDKFHHPAKYEQVEESVKQSFFENFDQYLEQSKGSESRERNYRVLYRILKRYEIYKGVTIDLDTTTDNNIIDIQNFIQDEHKLTSEPKYQRALKGVPESRKNPEYRSHNTICALTNKLKAFWKWCIDTNKTRNQPTIIAKQEIYGTPYYISIEELKRIESTNLKRHPNLEIQRDIFVFQSCIGCRVGDLHKLTRNNIVDGVLHYIPRKTKDGNPITVTVPLNDTAKSIIAKYSKHGDGDKLLPFISDQKYNQTIKRIFTAAGIKRTVQVRNPITGEAESKPINQIASSHLARRTFIGILYKQVKDPNLVGSLSGHKEGSKAFARYREIDMDMKRDLTRLLD